MTDPIRLVLVDDHRMFRSGVKAELDASMEIVGEAPDVDSAVEVVTRTAAGRRAAGRAPARRQRQRRQST